MPATGVRAPERMLVAVRAMAPVAGRPPNSGDATFAMPCAISSTLGSWRSPDMRSATTADSSDSIAPSSAIVTASGTSPGSSSGRNAGTCSSGRPVGMPPKRLPMVSTGRPSSQAARVPPSSATTAGGTRSVRRRTPNSTTSVTAPSAAVAGATVGSASQRTFMRSTNSPGAAPSVERPRKSLICVLAISTAMPLVKPITTGRGMKRTVEPRRAAPSAIRSTPAIIVHVNSPSMPCRCTTPATTTTNAPVGPPIWQREPPSAEIRKPVTIAHAMPDAGGSPDAIANAIASGSATKPTVMPARTSAASVPRS